MILQWLSGTGVADLVPVDGIFHELSGEKIRKEHKQAITQDKQKQSDRKREAHV